MAWLVLALLLAAPRPGRLDDGCGDSYYWRCGDICIHARGSSWYKPAQPCHCDGEVFGPDAGKWCCGGTNCTGGQWSPAICTNGVALNLNQSCQGGECNYHSEDINRNWLNARVYAAACTNTSTCVKEGEGKTRYGTYKQTVCTGDSSCEGELDWCREETRKNETCPAGFTRCLPSLGRGSKKMGGNKTKSIPGQCIEASDSEKNNCLRLNLLV